MRIGVVDIGSNTVHLLVVDAHVGAAPLPAFTHKTELRLSEHVDDEGRIDATGADALVGFVTECREVAQDQGCEDLFAFATSALREAPNGDEVLDRVRSEAGVRLDVLSGEQEAKLTFLAARRWFGWSSGRLLVIDIGGGSLEVAAGIDEDADAATSWQLGAGRLTRSMRGDPPDADQLGELRRRVRADLARSIRDIVKVGEPHRAVGTSKTIRSLARVCGAAPREEGPYVQRLLVRDDLAALVPKLAGMPAASRAELPGVSPSRAAQLLAGAVVIHAAMDLFGVEQLEICPWALREGVILRRLELVAHD